MKKILSTLAVMVLWVSSAQAGDTVSIKLPQHLLQCVMACQAQALECAPDQQVAVHIGTDCTQQKAKRAKKVLRKGPSLRKQILNVSRRVALLEQADGEAQAKELAALKAELDGLKKQVEELTAGLTDLAAAHQVLVEEVDGIHDRLSAIEERMTELSVGPTAGFVALWASDGSTFTSGSVGARVDFRFRPGTHLIAESDLLLAASDEPFGVAVRAGLGFDLPHGFVLETGVSGVFASLDSQLLAKSIFVAPDIGLGWKADCGFYAGARLLVGAEFDAESPSFALGGHLTAGWAF